MMKELLPGRGYLKVVLRKRLITRLKEHIENATAFAFFSLPMPRQATGVLIEAMAMGANQLLVSIGWPKEVIDDGLILVTVQHLEYANKIVQILKIEVYKSRNRSQKKDRT
jgi:glycosyltransferase involved in cell wall biosynthesis